VGVGVPPPPQSQLPALTITLPQSPLSEERWLDNRAKEVRHARKQQLLRDL
jgi:hypothetical protein